jgi:hypothetical protein
MTPKGFREQFLPLGEVRIITAGDGLWSPSIIRSVNFRLQAGCRIEDGEDPRGWLHGFFKREEWDLSTPIYTDTAVPRGIEIYLRSVGYRVSDGEVCWSEHGAQMDHATDFDISGDLIAQFWPELDEPALRAQFPAVQNAWDAYKLLVRFCRDQLENKA